MPDLMRSLVEPFFFESKLLAVAFVLRQTFALKNST